MLRISTEMAIMVHRVLFLDKKMKSAFIAFIIIIGCFSCKKQTIQKQPIVYNKEKFYYVNGVLHFEATPFSGVLVSYDEVNKTNSSVEYSNGKKHGIEIKKYTNDSLAEQRFYTKGIKTGIHRGWWRNGTLKFEYPFNKKGAYHGNVKDWYKNGQVYKDFNYANGKESGSQRMWQSDGKIRANFVTKNGERFGLIGLKKCYTINTVSEKIE